MPEATFEAYCMKCRQKQPSETVEVTAQSKHSEKTQMIKGKCTVCGTKTSKITKKEGAAVEVAVPAAAAAPEAEAKKE